MMDLKELFTEDDAVSPVIGVILMVAITVILAAVIGAFVLNIGGSQETAPQNQFDFNYLTENATKDVVVTHGGGGSVDATQLELGSGWGTNTDCGMSDETGLSAGDQIVNNTSTSPAAAPHTGCNTDASSGTTLEITWTSSSGEQSQIVADSTVP